MYHTQVVLAQPSVFIRQDIFRSLWSEIGTRKKFNDGVRESACACGRGDFKRKLHTMMGWNGKWNVIQASRNVPRVPSQTRNLPPCCHPPSPPPLSSFFFMKTHTYTLKIKERHSDLNWRTSFYIENYHNLKMGPMSNPACQSKI